MCLQELIYKEFFSQGDLVCVSVHRLLNGMWHLSTSVWRLCYLTVTHICVCVHAQEKAMGNRPSEMMDREKAYIPELQISFMEHIAMPIYK